jgi:hypothetical protein
MLPATSIWNATTARRCFATLARWAWWPRVEAEGLALPLGTLPGLAQDEESGLRCCKAGGGGGLGAAMSSHPLVLKRASVSRSSGEWSADDYDVVCEGLVGRIMKAAAAPEASPWFWSLAYGYHYDRTPTHGYAATREGAMADFKKSWLREGIPWGEHGSAGEPSASKRARGSSDPRARHRRRGACSVRP